MKDELDYIRDIAEIRSMMERTSKFLSLSGWAGIMAGVYGLAGAYVAYRFLGFNPQAIASGAMEPGSSPSGTPKVVFLALIVLTSAVATAIFLSHKKANKRGEKLWNAAARRLMVNMAVPLIAGGLLILIMISQGLIGLIAPFSLLFYGLALYNASKFTYKEVESLGLIEIGLGLFSAFFVEYGILCWALGFGLAHILYGIYMHYRYER
jgi:hypothetical protein